ncbi:hypothetical protein DPSP01_008314 [Paraphaeosphaeria sporulosa]|uniref:HMG box domain-containing protein n=1 Tax=Paraphaeosphaeria sporulosa TaxID=1460663 RepID=A0A177CL27_9PLEO|nr:uncharacterized protein CC84DRAFT_1214552 [Paraphaeosphaeria sporulosa]OAG08006.1 hypothetical protein CC84DRAFT_1214552 [Paraphaeosphaeria sporulosa]
MAPATAKATPTKKITGAGVKKAGRPPGKGRKGKASQAMAKMQAYFKENRSKYEKLDFKEQQKKLGEEWKKSPENPKNQA